MNYYWTVLYFSLCNGWSGLESAYFTFKCHYELNGTKLVRYQLLQIYVNNTPDGKKKQCLLRGHKIMVPSNWGKLFFLFGMGQKYIHPNEAQAAVIVPSQWDPQMCPINAFV